MRTGRYTAPDGTEVVIGPAIEAAVDGTRLYGPGPVRVAPAARAGNTPATDFGVTGEDSLVAARRLAADAGTRTATAVLVFASARNPGGGYLTASSAPPACRCSATRARRCRRGRRHWAS